MTQHWAASLIGTPWTEDHNCWWLVRHVFEMRYGMQMPHIEIGEAGERVNAAAIYEAARLTGFRLCDEGQPEPGDIVLMRTPLGKRHVGVMIETAHGARMLHSDGYLSPHGPVGSVVAQPMRDLLQEGYTNFEPWRRV